MLEVGNHVRINDATLTRRKKKRGSPLGRLKGEIVSLESPHNRGDRLKWIEVKWGGRLHTHRYSDVDQLEVVK
jgi:hypothetical protein